MSSIFENSSVYKIGDSFTMKNILNIVDKMNDAMPHHEFEPEPISEGGIRVKLDGDGYKTIRFHFDNWSWCPGGVKKEDLDRKLIVARVTSRIVAVAHHGRILATLYGAPEWTKDEVECVNRILCEEGMKRVRA